MLATALLLLRKRRKRGLTNAAEKLSDTEHGLQHGSASEDTGLGNGPAVNAGGFDAMPGRPDGEVTLQVGGAVAAVRNKQMLVRCTVEYASRIALQS